MTMRRERGFLLMEALLLILILSITFVSFIGVIFQALKVSSHTHDLTEGLSRYEALVFELESGLRPDLASYGGRGDLEKGFSYEIENREEADSYALLKSRLLWKQGKESLDFDFVASEQGVLP